MPSIRPLGYPIHQKVLKNGLHVIVAPDHAAPLVAVNLWYDVGSRDEVAGLTGFAHLFEHLMFQGSANVESGDHLRSMQSVGGQVNATTWFDRTNYFELVPTGALDLALWLEADRLATLADCLTQENLDTQREVVKEEKRQRYDNVPYGDAILQILELAFPSDHPYGHTVIGSIADLDAASLDDARAFFRTHYSPGNCVLTLAGDIEPGDGFARAKKYFGQIPAQPVPRRPDVEPLEPLTGVPRRSVTEDVPADAVYAVWRLPARETREFDALDIALDVLGGGHASRIHRRLVREDEIASGAGASAMPLIGGTSLGLLFARALDGVALGVLEQTMAEEVARLASEGPTDAELARSKVQFERQWLGDCARMDARADLIGAFATLHRDPERINTRPVEYASITADEVRDAAARWLTSNTWAILEYHRNEEAHR